MQNKNYGFYVGLLLLVLGTLFASNFFVNLNETSLAKIDQTRFKSIAADGRAGGMVMIKSDNMAKGFQYDLFVKSPNKQIFAFRQIDNSAKTFFYQIPGKYLKIAGKYQFFITQSNTSAIVSGGIFHIYPGKVSSKNSQVSPLNSTSGINDSTLEITIKLLDDYNNPIGGHMARLISSGSADEIDSFSSVSNEKGEISFVVSSKKPERVVYSVFDLTENIVLTQKASVAYFDSYNDIFSNSSANSAMNYQNVKLAAIGNSSSEPKKIEFYDTPQNIKPGESITFSLKILDNLDQVANNYNGTVRFSAPEENNSFAVLPGDYKFTPEDLGEHTFSLAMTFLQEGKYKIEVTDSVNTELKGEMVFNVSNNDDGTDFSGISITNPVPGTYSNSTFVISGITEPGKNVKIFDNSLTIGETVADSEGKFTFTTEVFSDGKHYVYAGLVNDVGTILQSSEQVELIVDSSPPEIDNINIQPSMEVSPSQTITIKIYPKEPLSKATALFNDNIYELMDSEKKFLETSIVAPDIAGSYPLSFVLVDELGNDNNVEYPDPIVVSGSSGNKPPGVDDVTAKSGDSRVTLTWANPDDNFNVKNYRIFYGNSPTELTTAVDTFTNSNTWYVPDLENGHEYFFAVVAVNNNGDISETFSNIVTGTPMSEFSNVSSDFGSEMGGAEALNEIESDVSDSGPGIYGLIMLSLFGGFLLRKFQIF